jgi:hypothetical protein
LIIDKELIKEVVMSQEIDLKEADRKVFAASFDDGLVDIFISSVTLMFAVGPLTTTYINK